MNKTTGVVRGAELPTLPEHLSSHAVVSGVRVVRSLVFCVMFCRSLFVLLSFSIWSLCCLSSCDLRFKLSPLVCCFPRSGVNQMWISKNYIKKDLLETLSYI